MDFELSPQAERDFDAVMDFYAGQNADLADRFEDAYEGLVDRLHQFPRSGSPVSESVRRALVPGFPISLFYTLDSEPGLVLRILHTSRSPDDWPAGDEV